ncbi:MAG: cation-translocating P-type ATPase [Campylobacterales bacterium]|nr:cation-translocating P-type ATPase [Campylobacterales bacterium]
MSTPLYVKSQTPFRLRLKSAVFTQEAFVQEVMGALEGMVLSHRVNAKCASLILHIDQTRSNAEQILRTLEGMDSLLFLSATHNPDALNRCSSSCAVCATRHHAPVAFKRRLVEFGLLSVCAVGWFVAEHVFGVLIVASPFSLVAVVSIFAALPLLKEAYEDIKARRFSLQSFMSVTLLAAIFGGEAMAAFEIIYILRGGMLLEEWTAERSKREIHKLVELDVKNAYVLVDGLELEVALNEVREGDTVVVRSGEKIPVDGVVVFGVAEVDEALINGRSEPAVREEGDAVFANTLVEKGRIGIRVNAMGQNTYISRILAKVEASLAQKSPSEVAADKLASRLLRLGTVLTAGTFLLTGSALRAFSVMIVMSCPCATVLAASTAISAGIARGARENILIKGGQYLEKVSQSKVFCFDKTGTLTTGKPVVSAVHLAKGVDEATLFAYAGLAEYRNTHPIAKAIVAYAKSIDVAPESYWHCDVFPGLGVKASHDASRVYVGNEKFFAQHKLSLRTLKSHAKAHLEAGETVVYVASDKEVLGFVAFTHEVREGTKEMLEGLRARGVEHLILLTGDAPSVAETFAKTYGFDGVYADLMPQNKADIIQTLKDKYGNVVMVGDGVNDTLAMSKADVAIAFACGGSEVAIEVANIAITDSNPADIVKLYDLSHKSLNVVNQNYWIGTGTNLAGVGLAAAGLLSPVAAGAIHLGHTVGIMANSSKIALR